jgi:hypothetical protein
MDWVPVQLPLEAAATAKKLAEAFLEVMLAKPDEAWERYREGSCSVITRDADGDLVARWPDGEVCATLPSRLLLPIGEGNPN